MTQVMIQPSAGNPASRRRWRDTLSKDVRFSEPGFQALLTAEQRTRLWAMHPTGEARFWGATSTHDRRMDRLTTGDVVLFTGQNRVQAIGEIGYVFRNSDVADYLWTPEVEGKSWRNVYTVLAFQPISIPYTEIWELPIFNAGDNFMSLRLLDEEKGWDILTGLGIRTKTDAVRETQAEQAVTNSLTDGTVVVPAEAVNTTHTAYEQSAAMVLVRRAEALLVQEYRATLDGLTVNRIRTPAGITDLQVTAPDLVQVVEAKSGSDHAYVRQALGQLLDYAPHSPAPVTHLAALFPSRPADSDIALLHRYGIDCVYRARPGIFGRENAPEAIRAYARRLWHG